MGSQTVELRSVSGFRIMETAAEYEVAISAIVAAVAGADESCMDSSTSLASLSLDSLGIVSIVAQCCARFGVEIAIDDILELYSAENVGEFVVAIRSYIERCRSGTQQRTG